MKTLTKMALALALTSVSAGTVLAHNISDAIQFDGKVVTSACQMVVEGADGKTVALGTWAPITVQNLGTAWKPFKISFTGCDQNQIKQVLVAGSAVANGLLKNDAVPAAKNTGIAVIHGKDQGGTRLLFNSGELPVWENTPYAVPIVDTLSPDAGIPFVARIEQTQGGPGSVVEAGDVKGTMNVFVDYQ